VALGRIAGVHGLRGAVRVRWLGDGPENLMRLTELWVAGSPEDDAARRVEVRRAAPGRAGELRIELEGVGDRTAAEALQGAWVLADRAALPELDADEHYWFELIGCHAEQARDGRPIGTVKEIWQNGAQPVLVIEDESGCRRLVPAVEAFLKEVDPVAGRVVIEDIPGLLDPA